MIKEFKEFALKGNLIDMAVGIVMGGAIGMLVKSLVDNLISPIVGRFTGGQDFSAFVVPIGQNADGEALNLEIGAFITSCVNFLILAFVIFMIIKSVNAAKKQLSLVEEKKPVGPTELDVLKEIRNALQKQG